jgi:hypothetical protein
MDRQKEETDDDANAAETEFVNARRIIHECRKLFLSARFRTRKRYEESEKSECRSMEVAHSELKPALR